VRRSEVFALLKEAMAMRAGRSRKRASKEFVRSLIWVLVAYAPLAAILVFGANTPLGGVLVFGCIFVPVTAAFVTGVVLWAEAGDEALLRGDGRTWGESGHPPPDQSRPGFYAGGSHGAYGGADYSGGHGGGDGGGGDVGGGGW
jgi:hypothetical protein